MYDSWIDMRNILQHSQDLASEVVFLLILLFLIPLLLHNAPFLLFQNQNISQPSRLLIYWFIDWFLRVFADVAVSNKVT